MTQKAWTEKKLKKIICVLYRTFAVRLWNIRTDSVSNVAWGLFYNNKKKKNTAWNQQRKQTFTCRY